MKRKKDLIVILLWPIVASILSFLLYANFFTSALLFLGIPSFYLSIKNTAVIKKISVVSAVSVPFAIAVDYLMEKTGGWLVPFSSFGSVRLFDYVPIDGVIWFFLYVYFILIYYETFLEHHRKLKTFPPNLKYLTSFLFVLFGLFIALYAFNPAIFDIEYVYIKFGLVFIVIPVVFVLVRFPNLIVKFLKAGAYFFYFSSLYEFTALSLNQWTFTGKNQHIGSLQVAHLTLPLEEFFFWILLGSLAILSFYEFFDDDKK